MTDSSSPFGKRCYGIAALTLAVLLWGSTFITTKLILNAIGPFALTFLRFVVAFLGLLPFALRRGFHPRIIFRPAFLLFGLTGIALGYSLQNVGLAYTSAGNASLIMAGLPAITALLSIPILHERVPFWRVLGIGLSIAGVALVSLSSGSVGGGSLLGDALVLGAVLNFALYTVQGRLLGPHHPALVTTTAGFGAGLLFLFPGAVWECTRAGIPPLRAAAWGAIIYLGLGASALTLFLWNFALQSLDASEAALYTSLVPIVGLGFAVLFGEGIRALQLLGGAMAVAGVWMGHRRAGEHLPSPSVEPARKGALE